MLTLGLESISSFVGERLGSSNWTEIPQERIDLFAEATGDFQWIHVEPARAKNGPFGSTVAHGYMTLSLVPVLLREVVQVEGFSLGINYGLNKVRFPSPVKVGSRIRANIDLVDLDEVPGGIQLTYGVSIEIEDEKKPACVAEVIYRLIR